MTRKPPQRPAATQPAKAAEGGPAQAPEGPAPSGLVPQVFRFPPTRFMGSKERLLPALWQAISPFAPETVLDLCSGSGVVSYMLKAQGCRVISNDYMAMACTISRALIVNNGQTLPPALIEAVATAQDPGDGFIARTFSGLYFDAADTAFLDRARTAIAALAGAERDLAMAALIRACLKKRPRGIFTYTGHRYDDGRRDLQLDLATHFREAAGVYNQAVFSNGHSHATRNCDIGTNPPQDKADLVYLDPPYFSPHSDNAYVRRYHFVEGLARDWQGVDIQSHTKTQKFRNYPTPFSTEAGARAAFEHLVDLYRGRPLLISYSSNSLPGAEDMLALLRRHRHRVDLTEVDHLYSFGTQGKTRAPIRNRVKELIFIAH